MRIRRHNFTIMELLLVMAVAGILLAITLPAFSHITQGKRKTEATTIIASKLNLARSYAVTNRCYTAVVFPEVDDGKLAGITGSTQPTGMFNASCRVAVVYPTSATDYTFAKWLPDDSWDILPDGVIIPPGDVNFGVRDASENKATATNSLYPVSDVQFEQILFSASGANAKADIPRAVIFKPSGRVAVANTQEIIIRVEEAVLNPTDSKTFIPKYYPGTDGHNYITYSLLIINPLTGKAKVDYTEEQQ